MKKHSKLQKSINSIMEYVISILFFLIIWQIYVHISKIPTYVLPSPSIVLSELFNLFLTGDIWFHLFITSAEVILGFVIGSILGMILGYIIVKFETLKLALMPYLIFAQTAPKIALVPLFVIWFGIGFTSKVILIISMVIFPVMSGMITGVDSIPEDSRNLMKILKSSPLQLFTQLELPYSLPSLFSSFKIGIVQAVIGAIVAEWISGKQGLGYLLTYASSTYNTPMLIAGIVVTIVVGVVTYELIGFIENKLIYWHDSKSF
ncbi:NitT/TauT family transport system permease protein [Anaerosphaera aminiphila DSM 21120]|uniref:NitT/TauT family transport system permease protein n=1 Tax=Anaerosphaera aminiphila DSM 21120 TaxID=1120995 RepID=A0A1M5TPW9_9FIRM|nr:ABC transporter permease [Anaerosphaera aminiphila]SHH52754.1 NitT/TauT family transport system permease protein [Anaerosphaera aminiphila DSM 21120]